ncbi:hypothetical protein DV736_g5925, partial [Chaetothyriales sp. CBS 134916]
MFSRLTSILWRRKGSNDKDRQQQVTLDCLRNDFSQISRKRSFDEIDQSCSELTLEDVDDGSTSDSTRPVKRPRPEGPADSDSKEGELRTSSDISPDSTSTQNNHTGQRRLMLPPPAISKPKESRKTIELTPSPQHYHRVVRGANDDQSIASEHTTSTTPHRLDAKEVFEAERARRRAEAESLGPGSGSGITSSAEHELFIQLSMRGYDPLIPNNWMLDFRTLPLALFADDTEDEPIIHAMHGSEFRATKALRDLFDTGKNLRDKIVFCPGSHFELVLRKAVDKYMHWSLKDARLPVDNPSWLPVLHIVMRKRNQKTADIVNELETSLHALAQRHRDERGGDDDGGSTVIPSIEIDDHYPDMDMDIDVGIEMTKIQPPPALLHHPSSSLPTLFGILLTHSMVYVFTFDPNIATASSRNGMKKEEREEDLSMRYVAKFDFSDPTMDVWNAFSVAIVCMIVRKVLLELAERQ